MRGSMTRPLLACTWCPGSSGVDSDNVPPTTTERGDTAKATAAASKTSSNLSMYDEVASFVKSVESEYLLKSTEHGYLGAGRTRKRTRGGSFEMFQVPDDFAAQDLVIRRPNPAAPTSSSSMRARASQHSGAERDSLTTPL
ncbi:Aste57867_25479 [Aphanomyces stellatus]|uniref:Aste57867_25479 protein n=1 Tax=Aphanomyces stellatus TaxID=120398 RepID=A0A485LT55_9STRA|nr:hypothetical protein As57867_025400 [Aphanomyces stellatus]VFU02102.1 Aste57867_25479 [Aphanomyces stellatus]